MTQPQAADTHSNDAPENAIGMIVVIIAIVLLIAGEYILFRVSGHLHVYLWFLVVGLCLAVLGYPAEKVFSGDSEMAFGWPVMGTIFIILGPPIWVLFPWFMGGPWPF